MVEWCTSMLNAKYGKCLGSVWLWKFPNFQKSFFVPSIATLINVFVIIWSIFGTDFRTTILYKMFRCSVYRLDRAWVDKNTKSFLIIQHQVLNETDIFARILFDYWDWKCSRHSGWTETGKFSVWSEGKRTNEQIKMKFCSIT